MAEQKGSMYYQTPYKFNGKELDEETGLYYYGARYYDPRISIWYSIDPLAEKYPNVSPYAYCLNNPVRFIDPTGMTPEFRKDENGNLHVEKGDNAEKLKKEYGVVVTDKNFKFKEGNVIVLNKSNKTESNKPEEEGNDNKSQALGIGLTLAEESETGISKLAFKAGVVKDGYEAGKGIYNIATAKTEEKRSEATQELVGSSIIIGISRWNPYVGIGIGLGQIISTTDLYKQEQAKAAEVEWHKRNGYPINDAVAKPMFTQDTGMYRECSNCPLKFR